MFARVTTFEGSPEQIEAAVGMFREHVVPWLREASGFRGWIVLLDRRAGRSLGLTFWTTEEAAADSPASGSALRDEVAAQFQTQMRSLDLYEVVAVDSLSLDEPA